MNRIDLAYRGEPEERMARPHMVDDTAEAMLLSNIFRQPNVSEQAFFATNPRVAGMMTQDNRVTMPSDTRLGRDAVMKNEAIRLLLQKYLPSSRLSDKQKNMFRGTGYGGPMGIDAVRSILARGMTGDPSANLTFEQDSEIRGLNNLFR